MAVFAPAAPFNTNPSYSGQFIPQLWSGKLNAKFYASTMLPEISNTNWEGEIKNHGDTINIRMAPSVTISNYTPGTSLNYEVPAPIMQTMQINQGKYFGVQVNDVLEYQADIGLMDMFTTDAAKQLKIAIENECLYDWFVTEGAAAANMGATAGVSSASYGLGTDASPVDSATAQNVLNAILRMGAVLDEQNAPEDGRWLMLTPYDRQILMQSNLAQAYFTGDSTSPVRNGMIGQIDRFKVYVSNLLPHAGLNLTFVPGLSAVSTGTATTGPVRRMMVAGTKDACAFASQISKTEPLRNQNDFGDIVRGLNIYGRKVTKPEALTVAIVK